MKVEERLTDWASHYHSQEDYQRIFYLMDKTMKQLHDHNYYITNFNPDEITFSHQGNQISFVEYKQQTTFDNQKEQEIDQNIYNLSFLAVGIYSETLPYLTPQFLKENFQQFKIFLPEEDITYYQSVLTRKNYIYYSDFKDAKNQQQIKKLNDSLSSDQGQKKGVQKTKATAAGKAYAELESANQSSNMAAFTTRFLLPFLILAASLLIPLFAFLLGLSS